MMPLAKLAKRILSLFTVFRKHNDTPGETRKADLVAIYGGSAPEQILSLFTVFRAPSAISD